MKKLLNIVLAVATLGGAALATASPAAAQGWRDRDGRHEHWRGDRERDRHWRDRDDRNWRRGWYGGGYGRDCVATWRWDRYWGRYVRVTSCY